MRQENFYAFTQNQKSIVAEKVSSLGSFYCREDFEKALISYLVDSTADNREFRRQELEGLCLARGLDMEVLLKELEEGREELGENFQRSATLQSIPGREEMKEELLEMFHSLFQEFHSPADYMKRIVHNLAPEYDVEKEPVRVIILKKFLAAGLVNDAPYKTNEILKQLRDGLSEEDRKAYDKLKKKERTAFLLPYIDGSIFENIPKYTVCDDFQVLASTLRECVEGGLLAEEDVRLSAQNERSFRLFAAEYLNGNVQGDPGEKLSGNVQGNLGEKLSGNVQGNPSERLSGNVQGNPGKRMSGNPEENLSENLPDPQDMSVYCMILKVAEALAGGNLAGEAVTGQLETFFRGMEKDLVEKLESVTYKNKSGKSARVSEKYSEKKKTEKDKITDGWRLLRVCNDLAAGRFHPNGQTRRELYHFAILFDMSYYFEEEKKTDRVDDRGSAEKNRNCMTVENGDGKRNSDSMTAGNGDGKQNPDGGKAGSICEGKTRSSVYDKNRDVEKNLFQDYYNDNLLRILATGRADGELETSIEPEASGEGINYKNYAECIYLYFIRNKDPQVPGERLKAAEDLIRQCGGRKVKKPVRTTRWGYTRQYREENFRVLMRMDVRDIPQYVADHYVVDKNADKITLAAEQFSAFDLSSMLIEATASAHGGMTALEPDAYAVDDRARRADPKAAKKFSEEKSLVENSRFEWKLKDLLEAKYSGETTFMEVVSSLQERLREIRAGRFSASERKQLIWVLRLLANPNPVSAEDMQREIERKLGAIRSNAWENGSDEEVRAALEEKLIDAEKAVEALRWLGFDIECLDGRYFLAGDEKSDAEDALKTGDSKKPGGKESKKKKRSDGLEKKRELLLEDAMMEIWDSETDRRMRNLIIHKMRYHERVTRNELLALYFNYFITEFLQDPDEEDGAWAMAAGRRESGWSEYSWTADGSAMFSGQTEEGYFEEELDVEHMKDLDETFERLDLFDVDPAGINSFQKLFDKFREGADRLLEEARYQPFSEKNILDMYLITELYFFAIENCGYMKYRDDISYTPETE